MSKINKLFVVFFLMISMQACHAESELDHKEMRGSYIYGHEVNTFKPCGQKKVFWVLGEDKTLLALKNQYKKYTRKPYAEVYLEMSGTLKPSASDGFAMDYDGQVLIGKILIMKNISKELCK